MAKAQKELDYTLDEAVLRRVKRALDLYYRDLDLSKQVVTDEDYESYPTLHYGTEPVVYSSTPSRKTESIAMANLEHKIKIKDAERTVRGIDRGIFRAAKTTKTTKYVKSINDDLRDHLIDKIPNRPYIFSLAPNAGKTRRIKRRPDTLKTYKQRAYYFIAVELNFIEASEEILRAEALLERSR